MNYWVYEFLVVLGLSYRHCVRMWLRIFFRSNPSDTEICASMLSNMRIECELNRLVANKCECFLRGEWTFLWCLSVPLIHRLWSTFSFDTQIANWIFLLNNIQIVCVCVCVLFISFRWNWIKCKSHLKSIQTQFIKRNCVIFVKYVNGLANHVRCSFYSQLQMLNHYPKSK